MPPYRFDQENDETVVARRRSGREVFARVCGYARRYPAFALGTLACAILSTAAGLAFPKLIQLVIDDVIATGRGELLPWFAFGLLAAYFFRDFFNLLRIQLNNRFEQQVIFDMRRDLYDKLQRLAVRYYDQRATGDLMTRVIDDVNAVERVLIDGIEQGSVAILTVLGVSVMLFQLDPYLATWCLAPMPLLIGGAMVYTMTAHTRYRKVREATSAMNSLLHDNLQGIRQIKGFGREPHESHRFATMASSLRRAMLRVMGAWSFYSPAMEFCAALGAVIVLWFGGRLVMTGQMTVGELVAFLAFVAMFYEPIRRLHSLNQMFQAGRAAGERVFDIMDTDEETRESPTAIPLARTVGEVRFDSVGFAYRSDLPVLHDLTIHAAPGQTVALVGPTGAGKTTIVNLLPRFYDVTTGCITVDGHDIRAVTLESLRAQVGIVSQEAFLFNGSLRENILYGNLAATEEEMIAAARAANCHEFIARALLKDPPILILDEATSSVDTATEQLIQEALERLMAHRTCFVIAHRLSTVRNADQILVLRQGQIAERGTHDELLAQNGLYAGLCRVQSTATTIEERLEEVAVSDA